MFPTFEGGDGYWGWDNFSPYGLFFLKASLREGFIRKKSCEFSQQGGGGSSQNFDIFTTFFFECFNSSKYAIKFFCKGDRGTPWPIYFENLDTYQLNLILTFLKKFLGFQWRIFLILHIMVFWSWIKKKVSQLLGGGRGQDQSCENSQLFFFDLILPLLVVWHVWNEFMCCRVKKF